MASLPDEVKSFIVVQFGLYRSPTEVADLVQEEFDIEITRQQANDYNAGGANRKNMAKKWVELFDETREKAKKNLIDVPIAQLAYRLQVLGQMARKALKQGNRKLVADLLKQAAEDSGGAYTNKAALAHWMVGSGAPGAPGAGGDVKNLTEEEAEARLVEALSMMFAKPPEKPD